MHRFLGILLLLTSVAHATTRTVAPGGSITACVQQSQAGDTCLVRDGTYSDPVNLAVPSGVTIAAEHPGGATIRNGNCEAAFLLPPGAHDITLDGFEIDGSGPTCDAASPGRSTSYGVVSQDMDASNPNTNITIQNMVIHDTRKSGLELAGRGFTITGNEVYNIGTDADIAPPAHRGQHGCYCSVSDSEISQNNFHDIKGYNIQVYASGGAPVQHNRISGNTFARSSLGTTFSGSGHTITGNTSLEDGGLLEPVAFILQSSSTTFEGNTISGGRQVSDQSGGSLRMANNTFCDSGCGTGGAAAGTASPPRPAGVPQAGLLRVLERP